MYNNLYNEENEEVKVLERRLNLFKEIREKCRKKVGSDPTQKPEGFLSILKKIEKKFSETRGACEILHEFYCGQDVEEDSLMDALEVIKSA